MFTFLFVYFFICHVISCLLTFLFVFCLHLVVEEEKDDGVMRIYFDPPHYTVMESVGSFMTTIVRKGGDHRFVYFFFCLPIFLCQLFVDILFCFVYIVFQSVLITKPRMALLAPLMTILEFLVL